MANYESTSGSYTTRLTVTQTAQSVENNTSTVTFSLTLIKNSGTGLWNGNSCPWKVVINGTTYNGTFTYDFRNYSTLTLKSSTTQTITHNGDGTMSISVSAYVDMDNTPYVYSMAPSGTLALTTIPRASDVSVAGTYTIGNTTGSISATITPKANFYHRWRWAIGSYTSSWANLGRSSSAQTVSVTNTNLLAQLPTASSGTLTITVETHNGSAYSSSTLIGSKQATSAVTINLSAIKPTLTYSTIAVATSPITGYAIKGYSTLRVTSVNSTGGSGTNAITVSATISGLSGASMATKSISNTSSNSISNGTMTSNKLPSGSSNLASGNLKFTLTATDSRGATTTVEKTYSAVIYGYTVPTVTLTAYRVNTNSSTSPDGAGGYVYVSACTATVGASINGQNSIVTGANATRAVVTLAGTSTTYTNLSSVHQKWFTLAITSTGQITLYAKDTVGGTAQAQVSIANATFPIVLRDNGSGTVGVGIAMFPNAGEIDTALPLVTNARIDIRGNAVDKNLMTRGIVGSDGSGNEGDLYINYGGKVTYFGTSGGGNISGDGKTYSGRANNATYVDWTETDTDTNTVYYLPFGAGYSDNNVNRGLLSNADLKVQLRNGTSSAYGYSGLILGNGTDQGIAGNKWGFVNMYPLNGNFYGRIRSAETLTGNRTVYIPDNSGTLLTDTRTSYSGANVLSRTSGLTISSRQAVLIANGEIVVVYLALTGNMTLAVGDNAFVGTLNTTNIPLPKYSTHDMTYYGSTVFGGHIDTSGNITVRVMAAGMNITTDVIALTFMYLKA